MKTNTTFLAPLYNILTGNGIAKSDLPAQPSRASNNKVFSSADLWNIRKKTKRATGRRSFVLATGF